MQPRDSKGRFMKKEITLEEIIGGLVIAVLAGGFWNGVYTHILLTTGFDVSSNETILLSVFNVTCNALSTTPNIPQQSSNLCHETYSTAKSEINLYGFVLFILPIIALATVVAAFIGGLGQNSVGLVLGGFALGLVFCYLLNTVGYAAGFSLMRGSANLPTTSTSSISTSSTSSTSTSTTTTTIIYRGTCNGLNGFWCSNATLSTSNMVSITLAQSSGNTLYNVQIDCGTLLFNESYITQFKNYTSAWLNNQVRELNLTCTTAHNGTFSGGIWISYTQLSGQPDNKLNSYHTIEIATVTIP